MRVLLCVQQQQQQQGEMTLLTAPVQTLPQEQHQALRMSSSSHTQQQTALQAVHTAAAPLLHPQQ